MFRDIGTFYGEELLAPRPTHKLEDHHLLAVRDCLFNIFAATLHIWRPFLQQPPEDAPCSSDRYPLLLVSLKVEFEFLCGHRLCRIGYFCDFSQSLKETAGTVL